MNRASKSLQFISSCKKIPINSSGISTTIRRAAAREPDASRHHGTNIRLLETTQSLKRKPPIIKEGLPSSGSHCSEMQEPLGRPMEIFQFDPLRHQRADEQITYIYIKIYINQNQSNIYMYDCRMKNVKIECR